MVKLRHIFALLAAFAACTQFSFAQEERLTPAAAPRGQGKMSAVQLKDFPAPTLDTLDLPFFDDFAKQTHGIPDTRKWTDRYVFINNTYAINQPTAGVATFDILDAANSVYSHASASRFAADTLTSQPIRLSPTDGGVYISFAYQPGGHIDMPESGDSLVLHFFSPIDSAWVAAWSVSPEYVTANAMPTKLYENYWLNGSTAVRSSSLRLDSTFFSAIVPINAPKFLDTGFRFRFINYATRSSTDVQGKLGNCDTWHLDLVYLNRNRSAADTILKDAAIQQPVSRLLKDYQSMPWRHLRNNLTAQREQLVNNVGNGVAVAFNVNNLDTTGRAARKETGAATGTAFVTNFEVACVEGAAASATVKSYSMGTRNIPPDTTSTFPFNLSLNDMLNMPADGVDSVAFSIKTIISDYNVDVQLKNVLATNDTSVFTQRLYTYYAYDDGTAEKGYGVYGELANIARVAVGFKAYLTDTLSGVFIYFNSTLDSGNVQPFKLGVWRDRGGVPGEVSYLEPDYYEQVDNLDSFVLKKYVVQLDSLGGFVFYPLKYPIKVEKNNTFYVGWVQQSTAMLNVGFDVNNQPVGKMFVSLDGYTWNLSKLDGQGALMIRPSFARGVYDRQYTSVAALRQPPYSITVYPNPVRDELRLSLPYELQGKTLQVEVFNLIGQRILYQEIFSEATINVSRLSQGTYFCRFSQQQGGAVSYARFVKL